MLLDSGSSVTILNFTVYLSGNPLDIAGAYNMEVSVSRTTSIRPVSVVRGIFHDCILGINFLVRHCCIINHGKRTLKAGLHLGQHGPESQPVGLCCMKL